MMRKSIRIRLICNRVGERFVIDYLSSSFVRSFFSPRARALSLSLCNIEEKASDNANNFFLCVRQRNQTSVKCMREENVSNTIKKMNEPLNRKRRKRENACRTMIGALFIHLL